METSGKEGFIYSQRSKKKKIREKEFGRIREGQMYVSTSTSASIYRLRFTDYGRACEHTNSSSPMILSPFAILEQPVSLWGKLSFSFDLASVAKPASRPAASQAASLQP